NLTAHFQTLLTRVVERPDVPVIDLPLLDADERRRILAEWNETARSYPTGATLHALFEDQAARAPGRIPLVHGDVEITFAEPHRLGERLARPLRPAGVDIDVPVVLCLEPAPEMLTAILGVLKAGGAYVPVDPATPKERLRLLLDDTRAPVVLTQQRLNVDWP